MPAHPPDPQYRVPAQADPPPQEAIPDERPIIEPGEGDQ